MEENNAKKKNVALKKIHVTKCDYPTCGLAAEFSLLSQEKETIFSCPKHLKYYSTFFDIHVQKELKYSPILLQNGKEGVGGKLFSSKSFVEPAHKINWIEKKKRGKIVSSAVSLKDTSDYLWEMIVWENSEKCDFSWGGQSDLILAEFQNRYFVFWQSGRIIAEISDNYKPIKWYEQ